MITVHWKKLFGVLSVLSVAMCALLFFALLTSSSGVEQTLTEEPITASGVSPVPYVTEAEAFQEHLRKELQTLSAEAVQMELKEAYAQDGHGAQHMAFHYFGEILYELKGSEAFPMCKDWYGYGCPHGFLLSAIDSEGYAVVPLLDDACFERYGVSMETETCQHGIGHGLLEFSGRDPHEAIKACDLVDDVFPKLGCASGVFMEYFAPIDETTGSTVDLAPAFDEKDPFNICDEFTGLSLATCLFEIQSWWQDVGKVTAIEVEALCNSVAEEEAREFCLIGYGNFKGPFVAQALPYCDKFEDEKSHALCRAGAYFSSSHHYNPIEPEKACSDLGLEYSGFCFQKGSFTCEVEKSCGVELRR
jgi:hypothetical protein